MSILPIKKEDAMEIAPDYMNSDEVMALFAVKRPTLYKWAREGKLVPCSKVGRSNFYRREEVMALLDPATAGKADHD